MRKEVYPSDMIESNVEYFEDSINSILDYNECYITRTPRYKTITIKKYLCCEKYVMEQDDIVHLENLQYDKEWLINNHVYGRGLLCDVELAVDRYEEFKGLLEKSTEEPKLVDDITYVEVIDSELGVNCKYVLSACDLYSEQFCNQGDKLEFIWNKNHNYFERVK